MTSILKIKEVGAEEAARRAQELLEAGRIVAFPTETVYGLAVRGDHPDAMAALYRLKGRDGDKPLARYVDSADSLIAAEQEVSLRVEKLMRAFWPGPLTLVIEQTDGNRQGYRCSSHPLAMRLAASRDWPLLGTSANPSGEPPLATAAAIVDRLGPGIDLVLDDELPLQSRASTVVDLPRQGGFQVLRAGEVDESILVAELQSVIVLVCSGNTCRSPLAAGMLRRMLAERDLGSARSCEIEVLSAGLSAYPGQGASTGSRAAAAARGLDLDDHRSTPLNSRILERADRIYTMTAAHREAILWERPELDHRVRLVAGEGRDIADPFGGDQAIYENCARELEAALRGLMEEL